MEARDIYLFAEITYLKGQGAFLRSQAFSYTTVEHLEEGIIQEASQSLQYQYHLFT